MNERNHENFIMLPTVDFCFKELMKNPKVRKGFIRRKIKMKTESSAGCDSSEGRSGRSLKTWQEKTSISERHECRADRGII